MQSSPSNDDTDVAVLPCSEKLSFDTKKDASASANVVQWRYGATVQPYRCQYCALWHLSSA